MVISIFKKLKVLMTCFCSRRKKEDVSNDDEQGLIQPAKTIHKIDKNRDKKKYKQSKNKVNKSISPIRTHIQDDNLHSSQNSEQRFNNYQQPSETNKKTKIKPQNNLIIIEDENEPQIDSNQQNIELQIDQQNQQQDQINPQKQDYQIESTILQDYHQSNKNLKEAIIKYYDKQDISFFHNPQPAETIISGVNGEYKANPIKAEEIMSIFKQLKVNYISKVRGDGNCFFRSLASNYLLTSIGQACQNGQDNQQIHQIFQEMAKIPFIFPTNLSESLGSSFSYEEIYNFVHETLSILKLTLISTNAVIQSLMMCLNDPFVDFALQIWIKSWLVQGMKGVMENEISPLCFMTTPEDILQQIQPQNIEGGDDIIFQLVACIMDTELSIIRVQRNGGFDSIQLQPLQPRLPFSCLQLNNQLVLWYKTGHYYIAYTERQMELLGNTD